MIDPGLQVVDFVMTPISKYRSREFLTSSRAAAIIHSKHGVTIRREELSLDAKRMSVLSVRTAVYAEQQWNLGAFYITQRICQQAVHFSSILALEIDFFGGCYFQFGKQRVVLMSKLTQRRAFHCIDLSVFCITAGKHRRMPAPRCRAGHDDWRRHQPFDRAARQIHSGRINPTIIGHKEADRFSVSIEA